MKTFYTLLILCVVIVIIRAKYLQGHNGRPHCQTEKEINEFYWRNNNDPTVYWVCKEQHVPAELQHCENGKAFTTRTKNCIGWDTWEWEEPADPPTMAY